MAGDHGWDSGSNLRYGNRRHIQHGRAFTQDVWCRGRGHRGVAGGFGRTRWSQEDENIPHGLRSGVEGGQVGLEVSAGRGSSTPTFHARCD